MGRLKPQGDVSDSSISPTDVRKASVFKNDQLRAADGSSGVDVVDQGGGVDTAWKHVVEWVWGLKGDDNERVFRNIVGFL